MGYIGLPRALAEWIASLGLSQFGLIIALMVFYVVLGCFLDGISIVVLTMGVLLPTITAAGIDLIWFGIFLVFVIEMAQITPPVGFNLFVLSGMTRKELPYLARVSFPMFLLMIAGVMLIYAVPEIATWLPRNMRM
jgi:TRAP-type C4-dicarboxylate transport system permease large subunit